MPCGTLAGVAATTNCQSNILFRILNEGSGVSGLELENWTINPSRALLTKLLLQRFGNLRAAGGNNDGLKRCLLGQALGAIGDDDLGIGIAQPFQPGAGEFRQLSWRSMASISLAMRLITAAA